MTPEQYLKLAYELGEGSWKRAARILADTLHREREDGFHRSKNQTQMPLAIDKPEQLL